MRHFMKTPPSLASPRAAYHHGDLRRALLEASALLLAERGVAGFSLREVARRAGVSPAAPAHHFGDVDGLLLAVATEAFKALAASLRDGERRGGADARARLVGQGVGYVRFAMRHEGPFRLMFRKGDRPASPEFVCAAEGAYRLLEDGVRAVFGIIPGAELTPRARIGVATLWSLVHGFADLAISGRFSAMAEPGSLDRWVSRTLPAALGAAIDGLVDAR
jgi:AcrR family transcriptional regulator